MPTLTSTPQERITAALRASGRTHASLAADLGLSRVAVTHRMTGRTPWTLADAIHAAKALEVPLDSLVHDTDDLPLGYAPVAAGEVPA